MVGDDRPFIACVVVLGAASWSRLAASLQLDPQVPASLQSPEANAAVLERIRALTREFPHYALAPTLAPWTIENGLMTPTLKLKRKNLQSRFSDVIETMYRR